ncbi:MAG: ABC transporter ATP-binding protein [Spirochaetaceae bacterium]|jgi:putative ABC transport system ATP-binding protein|nr:ABC transporter ATP-binding protein [Spirochaetaceae bacterium]
MSIVEMTNIKRIYKVEGDKKKRSRQAQSPVDSITVQALRGVDFSAEAGEFVFIMGPSGSGKSTLMNIIGCLDKPSDGDYLLDGINVSEAKGDTFAMIRNEKIGFVFQSFNLLNRTTALENVELPLFYAREKKFSKTRERALEVLNEVGLGDRLSHVPSQLSGGQQQRVAIARAMVNDPAFILADEPTGALDSEMTLEIMALLQNLNDKGKTILMVTHEPDLACFAKRVVNLRDGEIVSDEPITQRKRASDALEEWRSCHTSLEAGENQ